MAKQIQQNLGGIGFSRRPGLHTGEGPSPPLACSSCGIHPPQVPSTTNHCQATLKSHLQLTCQALHMSDSSTQPFGGRLHVYLHASCLLSSQLQHAPANQISRTSAPIENLQGLEIDFENDRFCSSCQVLSLSLLGILTPRTCSPFLPSPVH